MPTKILKIDGSSDCIQLRSYDASEAPSQYKNLFRSTAAGQVVWTADLPTRTGDAYVDAEIRGDILVAWSWSCYRVEINLASGKIERCLFTK